MKLFLKIFFLVVFNSTVYGQSDTSTSFLSKLYFPFDFGFTISKQTNISNGGFIKSTLEYRINQEKGLFIRFNYNNRSNKFRISENSPANVIEGQLKFDDYVIGLGYRIGQKKIKGFGLIQAGISTYSFPSIIGISDNFKIKENKANTPVFQTTFGLEYYIAKNAAFTIETVYILQTSNTAFWNKSLSTFGISFGLTTTLF